MLKRLQLEHFKCWRNIDLPFAPLTLLYGRNGAGKTTLLQALLLLKQTVENTERRTPLNLFGGKSGLVEFGSYRDLIFSHETRHNLSMKLDWRYSNEEHSPLPFPGPMNLSYGANWQHENNHIIQDTLSYRLTTENGFAAGINVTREDARTYRYTLPDDWVLQPDQATPPENAYRIPGSALMIQNTEGAAYNIEASVFNIHFERLMQRIAYLKPRRVSPRRSFQWIDELPIAIRPDGENTIAHLVRGHRQNSRLVQLVTYWLKRMELVDNFRVESVDSGGRFYEIRVVDGVAENLLINAGLGVNQVLPLVTLLYTAPRGSIVLLEQPEQHLHPASQGHLADLLLVIAEQRRLQFIVETHSEALLTRLQLRIAQMEAQFASPDNIKLYHCLPGEDGSSITPLSIDEYGQIDRPAQFFGNLSGDLDALTVASLERHRQTTEISQIKPDEV